MSLAIVTALFALAAAQDEDLLASTIEASLRGTARSYDALGATVAQHFLSVAFGGDIYLDPRLVVVGSFEIGNFGQSGSEGTQATVTTSTTINGWHSGGSIGVA